MKIHNLAVIFLTPLLLLSIKTKAMQDLDLDFAFAARLQEAQPQLPIQGEDADFQAALEASRSEAEIQRLVNELNQNMMDQQGREVQQAVEQDFAQTDLDEAIALSLQESEQQIQRENDEIQAAIIAEENRRENEQAQNAGAYQQAYANFEDVCQRITQIKERLKDISQVKLENTQQLVLLAEQNLHGRELQDLLERLLLGNDLTQWFASVQDIEALYIARIEICIAESTRILQQDRNYMPDVLNILADLEAEIVAHLDEQTQEVEFLRGKIQELQMAEQEQIRNNQAQERAQQQPVQRPNNGQMAMADGDELENFINQTFEEANQATGTIDAAGLQQATGEIEKLIAEKKITCKTASNQEEACVICAEEYKDKEDKRVISLKCNHNLCAECAAKVVATATAKTEAAICPFCRADI